MTRARAAVLLWPEDEDLRRLVRPMTPAEAAEHAGPGTGRCPWSAPGRGGPRAVDAGMRSGRRLAYGLSVLRRGSE